MRKLIAAVALGLVLTGCNYVDTLLGQRGADQPAAYTSTPECANAFQHQAFERIGVDRPC